MGLEQEKQAIKTSHQLGSRNGWCPNHTRETHGLFPSVLTAILMTVSPKGINHPGTQSTPGWWLTYLPPLKNDGKPIEL